MAHIKPFRGIYYNKERVNAGDVVAPPYDIITPEFKEELYRRSPYNIVRIDHGKEMEGDNAENKYTRARAYLENWLSEGILLRDTEPCYYVYRMDYEVSGEKKQLTGFFCLVKLEEFGHGIYPHEATHSKPRQDRLSLLKACEANTSPIFALYDSEKKIASAEINRAAEGAPYMRATDSDGVVHSFWIINDNPAIEAITSDLRDKAIFIADGHHRYETALEYQRLMRAEKGAMARRGEEPYDYVLMFLANISDGGLTVLPTHRLVADKINDIINSISGEFDAEKLPEDADILKAIKGREHVFGLCTKKGIYRLTYRGDHKDMHPVLRRLDVVILDEILLKGLLKVSGITYEMDARQAQQMVRDGQFSAAFFLNPTGINDVKEVASASLRMPPKSTYFYPKVMTGFVLNSLKN